MTLTPPLPSFVVKIRSISGLFDATQIKHGLQAMDYEVHLQSSAGGALFNIQGLSTRTLQLKYTPKGFDLLLPPFASTDDWEMLRDWLLVFNSFYTAIIISENDLMDDVEVFFSADKIANEQKISEDRLHQHMRVDETLHFYSIYREFYAGNKIFERVREQPVEEQLQFFYSLVRKSQYTNLQAASSGIEKINSHLSTTTSVINNKEAIVLQPADMIQVQVNHEDHFYISYPSIDKLIRHGWFYLDEKQIYIPAMGTSDWEDFCKIAREMSINTELFSKYVEGEENEDTE